MTRSMLLLFALAAFSSLGIGPCSPELLGSVAEQDGGPTCSANPDFAGCKSMADCRWLQPGCQDSSLPRGGCYSVFQMDCLSDTECPLGTTCQRFVVNQCYPAPSVSTACDPAKCNTSVAVCR